MHRAGEIGQNLVGVLRPEADRIGEVPRVGAAAHREGGGVLTGDLVVSLDQGLDGRAAGVDVKRHPAGCVFKRRGMAAGRLHGGGQRFAVGAGREPAVKALAQPAALAANCAADDGQRGEQAVVRSDAQRAAVGGGMQLGEHFKVGGLGRGCHLACQQAGYNQPDRVDGSRRAGGMPAPALGMDCGQAIFFGEGQAFAGLQLGRRGAQRAGRAVGHRINRNAALKINDNAVFKHGRDDFAVKAALFPVANREVGVRREAECRHLVVFGIVIDVAHTGFLIGSKQRAHGVTQLDAAVLEVFEGVEGQHGRTFIVRYAAPEQPAIPYPHREGVGVPAVAGRHNITVGDGGQILLPFGDGAGLGPADVAVVIVHSKAEVGRNGQRFIQRGARPRAERRAGRRFALYARFCDQAGDIAQDGFAVLFREGVNGGEG